jgi:hypothetical protein
MATDSDDLRGVPPERRAEIDRRMVDSKQSGQDEWAEAKRRIERAQREGGTFYTTQEVLEHLKSLEK